MPDLTIPTEFSATVFADDVAATAQFYVEHFGFETRIDIGWFVTMYHGERPYEMCVIARDHKSVPDGFHVAPAGVIVGFVVDDVDAYAARFAAAGVPVVTPLKDEPWGQRHIFITDPAGTLIDVLQKTTPDPAWLEAHGLAEG